MGKTNKLPVILFLDVDPLTCAQYHADGHLADKLIAVMTAVYAIAHKVGYTTPSGIGASQYVKEEVVIWGALSIQNWNWLFDLGMCLHHEWRYRNEIVEDHPIFADVLDLIVQFQGTPNLIPNKYSTIPPVLFDAQSGEKDVAKRDVREAYRMYYARLELEENPFKDFTYTKRDRPEFLGTGVKL